MVQRLVTSIFFLSLFVVVWLPAGTAGRAQEPMPEESAGPTPAGPGTLPELLPPLPSPGPAAAPGGRIAFSLSGGGAMIVGPTDGSAWRVIGSGLDPALSPDGARLAFARWGSGAGVFVRDLASGEERRIAEDPEPRDPTWSPDGTKIAYYNRHDIWENANPGGRPSRDETYPPGPRLVLNSIFSMTYVDLTSGRRDGIHGDRHTKAPAWSADGRQVVTQGGDGLYLVDLADPAQPRRKVPGTNNLYAQPAWSPAGDRLAAMMNRGGQWDVITLNPGGGGVVSLSDLDVPAQIERELEWPLGTRIDDVSPAWSPDGAWIAFASNRDGDWGIYRVPAGGGSAEPIVKGAGIAYRHALERLVSWGADPKTPIAGAPWGTPAAAPTLPVAIISIDPSPMGGIHGARAVVKTVPGAEVRIAVRYCGSPALTGDLDDPRRAGEDGTVTFTWIAVTGICRTTGTITATAVKDGVRGHTTATFPIR